MKNASQQTQAQSRQELLALLKKHVSSKYYNFLKKTYFK
jgi:hypothetical protein